MRQRERVDELVGRRDELPADRHRHRPTAHRNEDRVDVDAAHVIARRTAAYAGAAGVTTA